MMHARRGRMVLGVVIAVMVVGGVVASTASAATIVPKPNMEGTGTPPKGAGLLSKAALAQDHCAKNGRMDFNTVGGGPFCVNPWTEGQDNGGATAPGVTATTVKVVAYLPQGSGGGTASSGATNLATGKPAQVTDVFADWQKMYDYAIQQFGTYQLWGRTLDIELMEASGTDEAAQRADAVAAIAKKPFMVVDTTATATGGAPAFASAVAAAKIVTVSASTTGDIGLKQAPYRWNYSQDAQAAAPLTAAFLGTTLSGKKAVHAGDDLASKPRAFGVVYPTTGFDVAAFEKLVKQNGGPALTAKAGYDPANAAGTSQQATTYVSQLKAAGVTSVALFADAPTIATLMKAATEQEYFPEWILTGYLFHDYTPFARTFPEEQARHLFGTSVLFPWISGSAPAFTNAITWYYGPNNGNTWSIAPGFFGFTYAALHYAGPTLTAKNLEKGWFAVPATGGAATGSVAYQAGYGHTTGMPYAEYSQLGTDRAFAWYDPDTEGPANATGGVAKGVMMYLNDGTRVGYDGFPSKEPTFFDKSASVVQLDYTALLPNGQVPVATPCTGCPSGGTGTN